MSRKYTRTGYRPSLNPSSASKANKPAAKANPQSVDEVVELAKRAFALKKYEEAVEHYATALELA